MNRVSGSFYMQITSVIISYMVGIIIFILLLAAGLADLKFSEDRLRKYKDALGLKKANLVYAGDYQKVKDLVLPTRQTAFSKSEPVIWIYKNKESELFLGANQNSDLRLWLEAKTVLKDVHIVLDGTLNNSIRSNLKKDKLPKQQVELEGNFSKYFKLYCNEGQQVIALQIVAPDIMAYMMDNLLRADIEIINNQVALVVKDGAKSIEQLSVSIELAQRVDELVKAVTKVTKL